MWRAEADLACVRLKCIPGLEVCPHLYANVNEACGTEANSNECQKMVCLAVLPSQTYTQHYKCVFL